MEEIRCSDRCRRLHGRRPRRARDRAGRARSTSRDDPSVAFILVGRRGGDRARARAQQRAPRASALRVQHAAEVVAMDEPPAAALRSKKDSSMRVAIDLVKDGRGAGVRERRQHRRADGDLALRAEDAARHRPSGDRVACCRRCKGATYVLDLGANVDCTPSICCSSRIMGSRARRRGRRQSSARRSGCSTSARRRSRATRS